MKSRKQKSLVRRAARRRNNGELEWIGGCLTPPFFITDRDEPYRPTQVVWMELPYRLVVGHDVVEPEASSGAVARTLLTALERPLVGPARRPARVRVQDASLVREIREVLGDEIPIDVAPTPELDELIKVMLAEIPAGDEEASYFEGGRVSPEVVAKLFSAARLLFGLEPWKMSHDGHRGARREPGRPDLSFSRGLRGLLARGRGAAVPARSRRPGYRVGRAQLRVRGGSAQTDAARGGEARLARREY